MSTNPSERDGFLMAVGSTLLGCYIPSSPNSQVFSLIAGQCESVASAAISFN